MDSKRLDSILNNDFVLDCSRIVLTQILPNEHGSEKIAFSGPGTISQDGNGQFLVKIFCSGKAPKSEFIKINRITPGKIIHDSEFYALSATDIEGTLWQADRILPHINGRFDYEDYLVQGHFGKLSCVSRISPPIKKNQLLMSLMGEIEIPCNTVTESKTYVGKEKRSNYLSRNVAILESCGLEFEITKEEKWLTISVTSDREIKNCLITRITEALQFVLGYYFTESVIEITQGTVQETYIKTHYKSDEEIRTLPPVKVFIADNGTWDLFKKYLNHFIKYEEERWHPTYGIIHSVIQSSLASVEAQALTVAVAVEGLLKREFSDIVFPDKETKDQIGIARKLIVDSEIDRIKDRLIGALNGMSNVSAMEQLYELKNRGLIEEKLIKRWKKLRNTFVHGHELDYQDIQKYLDLHKSVLVLFYQLIFLAVGYTGNFTDYSEYGFPLKPFDKKMV